MNPDTLVALPPITAAQRQSLIALLRAQVLTDWGSTAIRLAHALDLHKDAVRAAAPDHDAALQARLVEAARTRGTTSSNAAPVPYAPCSTCGSAWDEDHEPGCVHR